MNKSIAFITQTIQGGGAERVVSVLANALAECVGIEVSVITFFPTEGEYELSSKVQRLSLFTSLQEYREHSRCRRLKQLRRVVLESNAEIVIPFLWFVGLYVFIALLGTKIKIIQTVRNDPVTVPKSKIKRALRNALLIFSWKGFVQTEAQRSYFPNIVRKKLSVIPNPIANEFFSVRADLIANDEIVMVGRLEDQKNHELLIEACKILREKKIDFKVYIYGEGSKELTIREQIDNANLAEQIKLCGRTLDVAEVYRNAGIYVLTSEFEGMPNSLMEAMAAGLACVSTNCPTGPSDLIIDKKNGYLIDVGDVKMLAQRLEILLNSPSRRKAIGDEAKKNMQARYSANMIAQSFVSNFIND